MATRYRCEIRDKARVYLHGLGRIEDAKSIGKDTSVERLRKLLSFSSIGEVYTFFNHDPIGSNPDGDPSCTDIRSSIPCWLLFGEEGSITTTRLASGEALVRHIGILHDAGDCAQWSIQKALRDGGCRLRIGKYIFAITRNNTTSIESIPLSRNDKLNIRVAGKILGKVPSTCVSMYDIARHLGVEAGKGVTERLCKHLGIVHYGLDGNSSTRPARHTALTNLRTRVVFEFRTIGEAAEYLRVNKDTVRQQYSNRETIPFYGDRYSIDIDYTD